MKFGQIGFVLNAKPGINSIIMSLFPMKKYMDENRQEFYDERAAIMEYHGKMRRDLAELRAEMEVVKKFGKEQFDDKV